MLIAIAIAEKILGLHEIPSEFRISDFRNQASEIMNGKSDFSEIRIYISEIRKHTYFTNQIRFQNYRFNNLNQDQLFNFCLHFP